MKLNELRQLIEGSVKNTIIYDTHHGYTSEETKKAKQQLDEASRQLIKLEKACNLDVSIEMLDEAVQRYFKDKGVIASKLSSYQYTDEKVVHPFDDDDEVVHNAKISGDISIIMKREGRKIKKFYEVFDASARFIGIGAQGIKQNNQNGKYYVEDIKTISILDLAPSFKNIYIEKNELLKDYPDIVNVFYQTLEEYQQQRTHDAATSVIKMMIDKNKTDYTTVERLLDAVEEVEQTGFNY